MKDDQRKGEGLRSDDGDGDDHLPLVSLGSGINPQVSWDMMMVMMMKREEDQTIEEGFDLW